MIASDKYKFALIFHSWKLQRSVQRCLAGIEDVVMSYHVVEIGHESAKARELLDNGIESILCYGGTAQTLLREIGNSLSIIERSDIDTIQGLIKAKEISNKIVLSTDYRDPCNIKIIEGLLDIKIFHVKYANWDEIRYGVIEARKLDFSVMVGGGHSCQCMVEEGGVGIVVEPSRHYIMRALEQAKAIAKHKRQEVQRQADFLAILKQLDDGVICVDQAGDAVFCSPTALRLLKLPPQTPLTGIGKYLEPLSLKEVLATGIPRANALVTIRNEQFMANSLPISLYSGNRGAVALFRDITSFQNIDRKIRSELYARGFVSRYSRKDLKGKSQPLRSLLDKVRHYAATNAAVHIWGETGTGKELVAHTLHAESDRSTKPFIAINCAALPESLLESELFGYEEGAFTGAKRGGKAGLFELANQGTLYLDEIGDINHSTQIRLLRVLEAKEVMRVGGARVLPVDVRIISASHKPLAELVRNSKFRSDLFFRLVVLQLITPPLRQRLDDIPLLLESLLQRYHKTMASISKTILDCMYSYAWPGNIRELFSVVERYFILLGDRELDEDLFISLFDENIDCSTSSCVEPSPIPADISSGGSMKECLDQLKMQLVQQALRDTGGDRQAAARQLGISYNSLWRILRGI